MAHLQILDGGAAVLVVPSKLVVRNYVLTPEPLRFGEDFAVRLVSDHAVYRLGRFAPRGLWACDCKSFKYTKGRHSCKHTAAVAPLVGLLERLSGANANAKGVAV